MVARNSKMQKKAQFVKRMWTRRFGKIGGELRFYRSRWAQYLPVEYTVQDRQNDLYAALLQDNPYVRAEAERRLALGWNFENSVRNALVSVQCDAQRISDIYGEVHDRIQRNDEVFEAEVSKVMIEIHNA